MRVRALLLLSAVLPAFGACGPPDVRPVSYADPDVACPGGRTAWNLEIVDQRVDREGSDKTVAAVRDGLQKSFPGCRWTSGPSGGTDSILIEIHRFASRYESDPGGGGGWEARVDWTVRATNAGGRTLTEFQADEQVSRPNYRGSNNEKESLSEAYQKAMERTILGLRSLPAIGAVRPPAGTPMLTVGSAATPVPPENSMTLRHLPEPAPAVPSAPDVERKSQSREAS
ncbi:MAG: hypothetical protein ACM3NW_09400 [Syntrophomonadaceae bacterium]